MLTAAMLSGFVMRSPAVLILQTGGADFSTKADFLTRGSTLSYVPTSWVDATGQLARFHLILELVNHITIRSRMLPTGMLYRLLIYCDRNFAWSPFTRLLVARWVVNKYWSGRFNSLMYFHILFQSPQMRFIPLGELPSMKHSAWQ